MSVQGKLQKSEDESVNGADDQEITEDEINGDAEEIQCQPCGMDEGQVQRVFRAPGTPSKAEVEEHALTHCPYRSWCDHCVRGQAKDGHHTKVTGEYAESSVPRVVMDYCFFQEDSSKAEDDASTRLTVMVVVETVCHSVWGYAVESKGAGEEWMVG